MQLIYHYTVKEIPVHNISLKGKNSICLDPSVKLEDYKQKYKNTYDAYKSYAKDCGKKYFAKYPTMITNIKPDRLHHVSDAVLQLYFFLKQKNK